MGKPALDLVGQKFGRLLCLEKLGSRNNKQCFKFLCDCGTEVICIGSSVKNGYTQSCGCYNSEIRVKASTTHGLSNSSEYSIWGGIKRRCYSTKCDQYHNYGGRGITVCPRWLTSFENFYTDMGPRPSLTHSIERIDNDLGYSPTNCRWATSKEQGRNRRTNLSVTYQGQTMIATDFAELIGESYASICNHIRDKGYNGDQLAEYYRLKHENYIEVNFRGTIYTVTEFARLIDICDHPIRLLMREQGYNAEQVIEHFNMHRHLTYEGVRYSLKEFADLLRCNRSNMKYWYQLGYDAYQMLEAATKKGYTIDPEYLQKHRVLFPVALY